MKFLLFADFHYAPGWMSGKFLGRNIEDPRRLQQIALEEKCDFIIHASDFVHGPLEKTKDFIEEYNNFQIPSYHCLGNHDVDNVPLEDMLRMYRMENSYYYFDCNGYRIIVIDPNNCYIDGKYIHFNHNVRCRIPECRYFIPPEQLAWLEETIRTSPYPCITISREGFGRHAGGVGNQDAALRIINGANARKKNSVLMCMNGHNHCDQLRILDGVLYFEVNSASCYAIPNPHPHYSKEEIADATWMDSMLVYDQMLYAIVTVEGTTIDIRGTESTLHRGVTIDMTDSPKYDIMGHTCKPIIRSARITL